MSPERSVTYVSERTKDFEAAVLISWVLWVQQAHDTALGSPFRWCHCLNVFVHRDADICVAYERLHNSHIFTVGLQQSTERMAKRMPTQTFDCLGSNGRWPDVVLDRAVWPQGLFAVHCRLTRICSLMAGCNHTPFARSSRHPPSPFPSEQVYGSPSSSWPFPSAATCSGATR